MKLFLPALFLIARSIDAVKARKDRALADLGSMWNIVEPVFTQDGLDFTFDYAVSNYIDEGQAYYEVYDSGCKEGGNFVTNGFILSPMVDVEVGSITDDATFDMAAKVASVPVGIDVSTITGNPDVYTETDEGASIEFCVRFGLTTLNDQPIEVNFLESLIILNVDLTAGFEVDGINVTPADQVITTSSQSYNVEGYMCDEGSDAPVSDAASALNQGSLITICIKPDADGIADGIKMRTVDSFTWIRDDTTQAAIESGVASGNLLTSFDETSCEGGDYCQFSSILFAGFYVTEGQVSGNGVASMQFGTARRLSNEDRRGLRGLQQLEPTAAAATSVLDLAVSIQPLDDGPTPLLQTAASSSTSKIFTICTCIAGAIAFL